MRTISYRRAEHHAPGNATGAPPSTTSDPCREQRPRAPRRRADADSPHATRTFATLPTKAFASGLGDDEFNTDIVERSTKVQRTEYGGFSTVEVAGATRLRLRTHDAAPKKATKKTKTKKIIRRRRHRA